MLRGEGLGGRREREGWEVELHRLVNMEKALKNTCRLSQYRVHITMLIFFAHLK